MLNLYYIDISVYLYNSTLVLIYFIYSKTAPTGEMQFLFFLQGRDRRAWASQLLLPSIFAAGLLRLEKAQERKHSKRETVINFANGLQMEYPRNPKAIEETSPETE